MLIPDISWREQYASAALNRKLFGVIPVGVYRGFVVTENGNGTVTVNTTNSVAVVETDGYSLTVRGDGTPETLPVPDGDWVLVLRGSYTIGGTTTAQLLVVGEAQPGDAVVANTHKEPEQEHVTVDQPLPVAIVTLANNPDSNLDFGELTIDLGLADQNKGGTMVDLGEM